MYVARNFGESSRCVWVTEYVTFSVTGGASLMLWWDFSPQERRPPFTPSYIYAFSQDSDVDKKGILLITRITWNSVRSHLCVSAEETSSHRPTILPSYCVAFARNKGH